VKLAVSLTLSMFVATAIAHAQQPATLTLAAALEKAERQNLELAAARERRALVSAEVQIAGQRPNPTLSFGVTRDTPHESFIVDQPIALGPKRQRRIGVAQQEGKVTEAEIRTLSLRIRRETRGAFFRLALARAESGRLADVHKLAERLHEIAQGRFDAGDVPRLEVVQADLEVARARTAYEVARQRERSALSDLNALLNEPADKMWELAGALRDLPVAFTLDELTQRSLTANPQLERLGREATAEKGRESLLRAERIPDLAVQVGADFNAPPDFQTGGRAQLAVTIPLFSRNQGEIARSRINQRVLAGELEAARRSLLGRVAGAYYDLEASRSEVNTYQRELLPAVRNLHDLAEESYRAGKANILVVLAAQRDVQEVERQYLESLFALHGAFAALEEAVGVPLD
jgi:cobalt-zinc-cadmium efflux system outer membrane protein